MRLVSGVGNEQTGACWMSALHWYTRKDVSSWHDHPDCVSPVVRDLCITLNDTLPTDADRERVIGPHLFAPVGTNTGPEDEAKRKFLCADRSIHVFATHWLRKIKDVPQIVEHVKRLKALPEIKTREDAKKAIEYMDAFAAQAKKDRPKEYAYAYDYVYDSANDYAYAYASVYAYTYDYVYDSAYASVYVYTYASVYDSAYASVNDYASTYTSVNDYAYVDMNKSDQRWFEKEFVKLILDCCAIGKKSEVCPTKTQQEVLEYLCRDENGEGSAGLF